MLIIKNEKLRKVLRILLPAILLPGLVFLGAFVFPEKKTAWITILMVIGSLLLFYSGIEKRTVGTRRMVVTAVMTALSVLGRFIFAAIPAFKPITAIVIIAAVWLGPEPGFLVGSLTAVISNFYFGQGPWTPFQMLAWGLIGLLGGLLAEPLKKSRVLLGVYGALAGVAYSMVMDIWTVLWYNGDFSWTLYLAALLSAVPHLISYSVSNVIFLLLLGRPFGEKLERVKVKYGV